MANLVLNGRSIDSIEEIAENFVEEDVIVAFRSGILVAWLEEFGYDDEASRIKAIANKGSLVKDIVKALDLDPAVVKSSQKRLAELAAKKLEEKAAEEKRLAELAAQRAEEEKRCKEQSTVNDREGLPDIDKVTNWNEAVTFYMAAAEAGNAYAQGCLAVCYDHLRFTKRARGDGEILLWARKSADHGNSIGQRMLGECYRMGIGVEIDYVEGVKWLRMAAEQGDLYAKNYLAFCYERGMGLKRDCELALKLYADAAGRGFPPAQYEMGLRYFNGKGVVKNWEKAVDWFRKAAENGLDWAQLKLGWCYRGGFGVPKDRELGKDWCLKATKQGAANTSFIDDGRRDKSYRIEYSLCGLGVADGMNCRVCAEQCPMGAITTKVCKVRDETKCSNCYNIFSCGDVCPVGAMGVGAINPPTACINCGKCMSACPEGAIHTGTCCVMDTDICSRCGICAVACPGSCIVVDNKKK